MASRQEHLDRMACNPNLSPEARERFRIAAADLRSASANATRESLMEALHDTLAENVPTDALLKLANVFDGYRTRYHRTFAGMQPFARNLFDAIVEAAEFAVANDEMEAEDACPGCGCVAGDGRTPGCTHPEGCGYWEAMKG